jgi:hypothetical protein
MSQIRFRDLQQAMDTLYLRKTHLTLLEQANFVKLSGLLIDSANRCLAAVTAAVLLLHTWSCTDSKRKSCSCDADGNLPTSQSGSLNSTKVPGHSHALLLPFELAIKCTLDIKRFSESLAKNWLRRKQELLPV